MFDIPVLLIIFNRPEQTKEVFKQIRSLKPKNLYVAADGPRSNNLRDFELTSKTRDVVLNNIDWPCDVKTKFRNENVGCGKSVSGSISWVFEQEEQAIILEDDCLPDITFFRFCEEMLIRYKKEKNVMQICGSNLQQNNIRGKASYYFSEIPQIWGWATWRDRWRKFSLNYEHLDYFEKNINMHSKVEKKFWSNTYRYSKNKGLDIWGYQWILAIHASEGKVIIPNKNLISNIGFGSEAAHTTDTTDRRAGIELEKMCFPLKHPKRIITDRAADKFVFFNYLVTKNNKMSSVIKLYKKIVRKINKLAHGRYKSV